MKTTIIKIARRRQSKLFGPIIWKIKSKNPDNHWEVKRIKGWEEASIHIWTGLTKRPAVFGMAPNEWMKTVSLRMKATSQYTRYLSSASSSIFSTPGGNSWCRILFIRVKGPDQTAFESALIFRILLQCCYLPSHDTSVRFTTPSVLTLFL